MFVGSWNLLEYGVLILLIVRWDYYNKYKINVFIYDVRNVILCVVDICDSYKY